MRVARHGKRPRWRQTLRAESDRDRKKREIERERRDGRTKKKKQGETTNEVENKEGRDKRG